MLPTLHTPRRNITKLSSKARICEILGSVLRWPEHLWPELLVYEIKESNRTYDYTIAKIKLCIFRDI